MESFIHILVEGKNRDPSRSGGARAWFRDQQNDWSSYFLQRYLNYKLVPLSL